MDGNGRWAKKIGRKRAFGHENGTKSVRTTVETCAELGIENLTLYAFSTENWNRPKLEVKTLMQLLISSFPFLFFIYKIIIGISKFIIYFI